MAFSNLGNPTPYFLACYGVGNEGNYFAFFRFDLRYSSATEGHLGDGDFDVFTSFELMCFHLRGK
jgi:hypothetical protein